MLSPRKQNRSSPSKQNQSPTRHTHTNTNTNTHPTNNTSLKPQKHLTPELLLASIHELQMIVLRLGGKVPAHLLYGFQGGLEFMRVQRCGTGEKDQDKEKELREEIRDLRIKLSNYQFELKKQQQDWAQYKVLTTQQRSRQSKKLKSEITKLQCTLKQDNNKWQQKIHELRLIYQTNMTNTITKNTQDCQNKIKEIKDKVDKEVEEVKRQYEAILGKIREEWRVEVEGVRRQMGEELVRREEMYAREIERMRVRNVQVVQKLEKRQQQIIICYDSEKKTQQKKQDQQKITSNKLKQKLYNDLYLVRRQKQQLHKKILQLRTQILQKSKQKQRKDLQIKQIKELHLQEIQRNRVKYIHQMEKIRQNGRLEVKELCRVYDGKLEEYEKIVKNLEVIKAKRQALLQEGNQEIYKKFQSRPSKAEDSTVIQKLNFQLMNKQEELNSARFQLKQAKMERENNEKNYTRIFSAHVHKQREVRERVYERPTTAIASSRQKPCKQGYTIDMSFLLKACNKNF